MSTNPFNLRRLFYRLFSIRSFSIGSTGFRLLVLAGLAFLAACQGDPGEGDRRTEIIGGDWGRGRQALQDYGCISCHTIPGVPRANATVGPPLDDWADRGYIAGALSNNPDNLIYWIRFPQEIEPGTAMPDLGVSEADAQDMAAYLFTLRR